MHLAAVDFVLKQGFSSAEAARKTGVHRATIGRWIKKRHELYLDIREVIPTATPVPKTHPNGLPPDIVAAIFEYDKYIIAVRMLSSGCNSSEKVLPAVSLSGVDRTVTRAGLTRRVSQRKRLHAGVKRPLVHASGDLVRMDTAHFVGWRTDVYAVRSSISAGWHAFPYKYRRSTYLVLSYFAHDQCPYRHEHFAVPVC